MAWSQWDDAEVTLLLRLARVRRLPRVEIARRLGRSERAVSCKLSDLANAPAERTPPTAAWGEAPARILNDDLKHCLAVLRADAFGKPAGCGFPVLPITAAYRIAA